MGNKPVVKIMLIINLMLFTLYQSALGAEWLPMETGFTNDFYGVWGSAENDVYAVGTLGINLHYDGNAPGEWELLEDISP